MTMSTSKTDLWGRETKIRSSQARLITTSWQTGLPAMGREVKTRDDEFTFHHITGAPKRKKVRSWPDWNRFLRTVQAQAFTGAIFNLSSGEAKSKARPTTQLQFPEFNVHPAPEETNSTSHQSFIFNLSYFHRRPVEPAFSMNGTFLFQRGGPTMKKPTYILLEPLKPCHFICRNRSCFIPQRPSQHNDMREMETYFPFNFSFSSIHPKAGPTAEDPHEPPRAREMYSSSYLLNLLLPLPGSFSSKNEEKGKSIANREGGVNWSFYTDSGKIVLSQTKLK